MVQMKMILLTEERSPLLTLGAEGTGSHPPAEGPKHTSFWGSYPCTKTRDRGGNTGTKAGRANCNNPPPSCSGKDVPKHSHSTTAEAAFHLQRRRLQNNTAISGSIEQLGGILQEGLQRHSSRTSHKQKPRRVRHQNGKPYDITTDCGTPKKKVLPCHLVPLPRSRTGPGSPWAQ